MSGASSSPSLLLSPSDCTIGCTSGMLPMPLPTAQMGGIVTRWGDNGLSGPQSKTSKKLSPRPLEISSTSPLTGGAQREDSHQVFPSAPFCPPSHGPLALEEVDFQLEFLLLHISGLGHLGSQPSHPSGGQSAVYIQNLYIR